MRRAPSNLPRVLVAAAFLVSVAGCGRALVGETPRAAPIAVTTSASSPAPGETFTLTATALPGQVVDLAAVRWTTNAASVVSLATTSGPEIEAQALGAGRAVVTATVDGASASITITVLPAVGTIVIDGPLDLDLGAVATYTATVTDATGAAVPGASVAWVANGSVALASSLQAVGPSVGIRATSLGPGAVTAMAGGRAGQIAVNVVVGAGGALTVVTANDQSAPPTSLAVGQTLTVAALFAGTGGVTTPAPTAIWQATGGCTATDLGNGQAHVAGASNGACSVTATSMGAKGVVMFDVVTLTGVKITGSASGLALGDTVTLQAVPVAGAIEVPSVPVTWSEEGPHVVNVSITGNSAAVTGYAVGQGSVVATVATVSATAPCAVVPVSLLIAADRMRLLAGSGATVTVTPRGTGGVAGRFLSVTGVALAGAGGFSVVGDPQLTTTGLVTFALTSPMASSPKVTATFGALTSNALAFTLTTVASVAVVGPNGPVRIGSALDLSLDVRDPTGMPLTDGAQATWSDPTGVLTVPASTPGFAASATVAKLGPSMLVATVEGVASPVYTIPGVPNMVIVAPFSPASIKVGAAATTVVTVLDTNGAVVPGVPASMISLAADDPTKVSFGAGVAMADGIHFTATGLAATAAAGVDVTATWTLAVDDTVDSGAVPLVVTAQ